MRCFECKKPILSPHATAQAGIITANKPIQIVHFHRACYNELRDRQTRAIGAGLMSGLSGKDVKPEDIGFIDSSFAANASFYGIDYRDLLAHESK